MTYPTYHNLIGGEWLPAASGKTILNLNPADHSDVVGAFPSSGAEDVARAVAAAKKAFATWRLVPAPKRAEILVRAGNPPAAAQGAVRPRHDPRDGQGARRDPRRRAGSHRRGLLRRRRRPPPLRPDHPLRAAEQVRHDHPHARRRRRPHHAVELPHGHPQLEALSRARLRQHLRHQARH